MSLKKLFIVTISLSAFNFAIANDHRVGGGGDAGLKRGGEGGGE